VEHFSPQSSLACHSCQSSQAAGIVKSKSNIANNRSASPIGVSHSGPWNAVVLCSSCAYPSMPEEGFLIVMDSQTGEIWAYSDDAMVGKPIRCVSGD
jgi:hypothetical protein